MARLEISPLEIPELKNQLKGPQYMVLKGDLLALLFTQMITRFGMEMDADGKPWEPLKPDQEFLRMRKVPKKRRKKGSIKILQDQGVLRQSWTQQGAPNNETQILENEVTLASTVEYVQIHNAGGTINHPGTDNGFGKGIKIPPYTIEMPERRMDGFSTQDLADIDDLFESHLAAGGFK